MTNNFELTELREMLENKGVKYVEKHIGDSIFVCVLDGRLSNEEIYALNESFNKKQDLKITEVSRINLLFSTLLNKVTKLIRFGA